MISFEEWNHPPENVNEKHKLRRQCDSCGPSLWLCDVNRVKMLAVIECLLRCRWIVSMVSMRCNWSFAEGAGRRIRNERSRSNELFTSNACRWSGRLPFGTVATPQTQLQLMMLKMHCYFLVGRACNFSKADGTCSTIQTSRISFRVLSSPSPPISSLQCTMNVPRQNPISNSVGKFSWIQLKIICKFGNMKISVDARGLTNRKREKQERKKHSIISKTTNDFAIWNLGHRNVMLVAISIPYGTQFAVTLFSSRATIMESSFLTVFEFAEKSYPTASWLWLCHGNGQMER